MLIYSDTAPPSSCRDLLIEQLMREIVELMVRGTQGTYTEIMELKERTQDLEGQVQANYELIGSVRQQMEQVSVVIMTGGTAIIVYLIAAENQRTGTLQRSRRASYIGKWYYIGVCVVETAVFIKIKENELLKD